MDVEPAGSRSEETVIRPRTSPKDGPVDPEADEAELPPVRVTRENEIDLAGSKARESERVV